MSLLCLVGLHDWRPSRNPAPLAGATSRRCDRCGLVELKTGLSPWERVNERNHP